MLPEDQNNKIPDSSLDPGAEVNEATVLTDPELTPGSPSSASADAERAAELAADVSSLVKGKTVIKERFVLEELLGSGGMGTVYKAVDLRKVEARDRDPWLAIKLLNDKFKKHSSALISLQREARKSQALTHPNIIKVFDFDRDADVVFMTMEMLQGQSLKHYIQSNPQGLGVEQTMALGSQMGEALQHAHESGIIHADFSPKNVFLTDQGEAKVLDFGIAQAIAVADTRADVSDNTVFDPATLGGLTPGYASFEQLTGKKPVIADDVFALGCVIYQLLCGNHPHDEKTALDALSQKIRPRRIDKLSSRQWRALKKSMALLREDRYSSVAQFLRDFVPQKNPAVRPVTIAAVVALLIAAASVYLSLSTYSEKQSHKAELLAQQQAIAASRAKMEEKQALELQRSERELERINREYLTLAEVLITSDQYDEAQQYLDKVGASNPGFAGLVEMQTRLAESRTNYLQRMATLERSRIEVNRLLEKSEIDIAAGKLVRPPGDSAYSAYQQIVALQPDDVQARTLLQRLVQLHLDGLDRALQLGQLQEASGWLDDLVMISPDNRNLARFRSELKQALALEQQRAGRINTLLEEAGRLPGEGSAGARRDIYLQILEIDPRNASAAQGLALAGDQLRQGKIRQQQQAQQDAQSLLQQASRLLDKKPLELANYQQAREYLLEAQRIHPESTQVADLLGQVPQQYIQAIQQSIEAKEYDKASAFLQAATVLMPQDATLLQLQQELTELVRGQEQLVLPSSF